MIIIWHYRDLRLEDNPALVYASQLDCPVLPIYIDDIDQKTWTDGACTKWWLHYSLLSLQKSYKNNGVDLLVKKGSVEDVFNEIAKKAKIEQVCWNERYQPYLRNRDDKVQKFLEKQGIKVSRFNGNYLIYPDNVKNSTDSPYTVYSPFAKFIKRSVEISKPINAPKLIKSNNFPVSNVDDLKLLPKENWVKKLDKHWQPGRESALIRFKNFKAKNLVDYKQERDFVDRCGTSLLSPSLAFGEVSPREIWHECINEKNSEPFLNQLLWREFGNYFLYHFPQETDLSWRKEFENYPWSSDKESLDKWKKGETGYPIVDAAMKQLWETGWMHNRARMIVASFLIKHLSIHWKEGAKYFWDCLVDADLANNTLGWQWVCGSGPDAAPYFRIFNPMLQAKKFDPKGLYIKNFLPQLENLDGDILYSPWEASSNLLAKSGVELGKNYPFPIVDHQKARQKALAGFEKIKKS